MIELAVALGWRIAEVYELGDADLATLVDVLDERAAAGKRVPRA